MNQITANKLKMFCDMKKSRIIELLDQSVLKKEWLGSVKLFEAINLEAVGLTLFSYFLVL